jgi:hypothetical protein
MWMEQGFYSGDILSKFLERFDDNVMIDCATIFCYTPCKFEGDPLPPGTYEQYLASPYEIVITCIDTYEFDVYQKDNQKTEELYRYLISQNKCQEDKIDFITNENDTRIGF